MDAIRDILANIGIDSVDEMDVNECYTVEVDGFEDLTIEKIGDDHLSVMQHYTQRMDLMRDPEIVFDVSGEEWLAVEFRQDPTVHQHDDSGLMAVQVFAVEWSENLREQGFVEASEEMVRKAADLR